MPSLPTTGNSIPPGPPFSVCPLRPSIFGMQGPWMSASSTPTSFLCRFIAKAMARFAVMVLLPTPPLPLIIAILCLILLSFNFNLCCCSYCCFLWSLQLSNVEQELHFPSHSSAAFTCFVMVVIFSTALMQL